MDLINVLKECHHLRGGGRRLLRRYGISNDAEFTQPFAEMDPGIATRLIMNWLTLKAKDGYEVELRMKVPEEQTVYSSKIRMHKGTIFVQQIRKRPELVGTALHQWESQANYQTPTFEEIMRSVHRADLTNYLEEDGSVIKDYIETIIIQKPMNFQEETECTN